MKAKSQVVSLIKFLGKRPAPAPSSHEPAVHPLSGSDKLPSSFFAANPASSAPAAVSASKPSALLSILDLPARFQTPGLSEAEIEQVNSGAAEHVY